MQPSIANPASPLFSQDFCLDLFEPSGHGKKRKRAVEANVEVLGEFLPKVERLIKRYNDSTPYTKFKENIEYTVMMPDGKLHIFQCVNHGEIKSSWPCNQN